MNKIPHIISREYTTRVRKKSFIIMTIIGPVLFAAFMVIPVWLTQLEDSDLKTIGIIEMDPSGNTVSSSRSIFKDVIPPTDNLKFDLLSEIDTSDIENLIEHTEYYGILVLNQNILEQNDIDVNLFTKKQPSLGIESHIVSSIEDYLYNRNLLSINLSPEKIDSLKVDVNLTTNKYDKGEFKEQKLVDLKRGIGYASGFLIYFFIFFFGAQVMRGVIEEKTNRIVEIIVTSVRPFQLMMGKIIGIALVALTQFTIWVILSIGIFQVASFMIMDKDVLTPMTQSQSITEGMDIEGANPEDIVQSVDPSFNFAEMVSMINPGEYLILLFLFLFYFIGGYVLYAALFAAVGSAADTETDTQQFMLPITIPLILSIFIMINAITNPEGQLVYWFSLIPFTSPIVMMARIPFDPPVFDIILSMSLLVITFVFITWVAAKIYRVGILMYGKKVNYREIWKWLKYKD